VGESAKLLAGLQKLPQRIQNTRIVKRTAAVLDFLCSRGSAAELDDHLRTLADNDALALEGSYSLTRFITWAIPILGFLGTVLGITKAISGVTPDRLENDLSAVTDGLAEAFDTTALALALTMLTMFLTFIVERVEQGILDAVDRHADRELAHRFERMGAENGEFVAALHCNTDILLQAVEQLVQRQATLWAQTFAETSRQREEAVKQQQECLTASLDAAMERSLEAHARRLTAWEKQVVDHSSGLMKQLDALAATVRETGREQQERLAQVTQSVMAQVEVLARLSEGEKHLRRLQEALNQNLAALAGAGTFDEALHSLTAAIHLLTARTATPASGTNRLGIRPGAAA
jgi:biopolymer transport protein ExbB/TolQ